ncbi:MAG: AMP-binding protein [Actinomycetia bacterium]|nr:AMP-binding protein [Actinomycetes bacterium]
MVADPIPLVDIEIKPDDSLILRSPHEPGSHIQNMVDVLIDRAGRFPDRTLVAEKADDGQWKHLTYAAAVAGARSVAQWLLDNGASVKHPIAILSRSSWFHFLTAWGAQMAAIPYTPVSVAYSTVPGAFPKLHHVLERVEPGFVFAETFADHEAGLTGAHLDATIVSSGGTDDHVGFDELLATTATAEVDRVINSIGPDTVTRYMFTSGSTGMPKGVIHTHRMASHFLAGFGAFSDSQTSNESRVLDWMPWSHVGAGVMRLNAVITNAGSVYLDRGRPIPGQFQTTIDNIRDVLPTTHSGSPLGWSMLADALEHDDDLARSFFANLNTANYGSAAMPAPLAARLNALMDKYMDERIQMTTSLLSTEVSACLLRYWETDDLEVAGLPTPGAELKLLAVGAGRYELRARGGGVTPGYLNAPEATAEAFDEDGFFKMGDAVRFLDPDNPTRGLCFAGRVAEDFKLQSGTWVSAGNLRAQVVAAASPFVRDAVVCGLNEDYVALLLWPNTAKCQAVAPGEDIYTSSAVHDVISAGLATHNADNPQSSVGVARYLLLETEPNLGTYEITEKGYVNQRAVQEHRSAEVERLFAAAPDSRVVVL